MCSCENWASNKGCKKLVGLEILVAGDIPIAFKQNKCKGKHKTKNQKKVNSYCQQKLQKLDKCKQRNWRIDIAQFFIVGISMICICSCENKMLSAKEYRSKVHLWTASDS